MTPRFARLADADDETVAVDPEVSAAYGPLPALDPSGDLPALVVNFAVSLDGRITFGPEHPSPRHLTGGALHDRWLMGLLRARVDAVLIGGRTLADDPAHVWTPEAICPEDASLLARVRDAEDRTTSPTCVVATRTGRLPADARVLAGDQPLLVVTTGEGAETLAASAAWRDVEVCVLADDPTATDVLVALAERGCTRVLSEAGPGLYAPMLAAGVAHELYMTVCPVLVGSGDGVRSLADGARFDPFDAPRPGIRSIRSGAGQVYLRVRVDGS